MDAKFINAATTAAVKLGKLTGAQAPGSPQARALEVAFDVVQEAFGDQLPVTGAGAAQIHRELMTTMRTLFTAGKDDARRTVVSR